MRRQVKPFVTEYRGSPRRKDSLGQMPADPGLPQEKDEPRRGEPSRFTTGAVSEDTYEAALRAADALFSNKPSQSSRQPRTSSASEQAQPDFDQPDFGTDERGHDAPAGADPQASPPDGRTPGRILPAMDRPEVDPFAELEAERAPKRRGRKPGSKNKPKLPALVGQQPATGFSLEAFSAEDEADDPFDDVGNEIATGPAGGMPITHVVQALLPQSSPRATVGRTRGDDRFAWVRTRLRPGQKWKRRLPKVAW